jgi:hypothetical protein
VNHERLQFIKHRITRNQSAPDVAALALELCEALEKHVQPPPVDTTVAAVPAGAAASVPAVTTTAVMDPGELGKLVKETAEEIEAEGPKKRGKK